MRWQRLMAVCLAPDALWLVFAYEHHFLDGVNLAFHEAGHLWLGFGGQTRRSLGGTLGERCRLRRAGAPPALPADCLAPRARP